MIRSPNFWLSLVVASASLLGMDGPVRAEQPT